MAVTAVLALEDGTILRGQSIGADGLSSGEVVFNTSMTGYQEILTDPSYARQIVTLTYPHIGNTGINDEDNESDRVWASGLIIRDLPLLASNFRCQETLSDFLRRQNVVAIAEIDTRHLTRLLRDKGPLNGCLLAGSELEKLGEDAALTAAREFPGLKGMDLAREVSVDKPLNWETGEWQLGEGYSTPKAGRYKVVAYDFGVKRNILGMLTERNCQVTVVPAQTPAEEVLAMNPDGVFLSNGPGDPATADHVMAVTREVLGAARHSRRAAVQFRWGRVDAYETLLGL